MKTGPKALITPLEWSIVRKMQCNVSFPPATSSKRFVRSLTESSQLTDKGRRFLAFIAHRFRRQWLHLATPDERNWIVSYNMPRKALAQLQEKTSCQSSLAF